MSAVVAVLLLVTPQRRHVGVLREEAASPDFKGILPACPMRRSKEWLNPDVAIFQTPKIAPI